MLQQKVKIDYSVFERKMGELGTKVIPRAKITTEYIAKYALRAIKLFTLRGSPQQGRGSRGMRTPGRKKISELWQLTQNRRAYQDIYTIYNAYPNQDVIVYMEEGTAEHEIRPKNKEWLFWTDEQTGEDIFTKLVHHPGIKATHMMKRTEEEVINPKIEQWMRATLAMIDKVNR